MRLWVAFDGSVTKLAASEQLVAGAELFPSGEATHFADAPDDGAKYRDEPAEALAGRNHH